MPCSGSCGRYSWSRNRLSGSQIVRVVREDGVDVRQRFDDLDARAAAALIRLENRRPGQLAFVAAEAPPDR